MSGLAKSRILKDNFLAAFSDGSMFAFVAADHGFSPSEVLELELDFDLESEELLELLSDDIADVELKKV
ncbi:hypothetical protein OUZ56_024445 [Daphnia magna]|uniref:Uncharacterized protein n=1 Tax=Daphnia magna TaxID=35525 RepID=A0ABR0B0U2_9CRUS|nr:hypothetical protein OUZ56_024445 [Daphnia magna]